MNHVAMHVGSCRRVLNLRLDDHGETDLYGIRRNRLSSVHGERKWLSVVAPSLGSSASATTWTELGDRVFRSVVHDRSEQQLDRE